MQSEEVLPAVVLTRLDDIQLIAGERPYTNAEIGAMAEGLLQLLENETLRQDADKER